MAEIGQTETRYATELDSSFKIDIYTQAGQVTLDNANVVEVFFIEDIFSFCMTGKIIFLDKTGMMEFAPITGNEMVSITYGVKNNIKVNFKIFSLMNISGLGFAEAGSQQMMEIVLVEPRYFAMTSAVFSRSWKNYYISDIIKEISNNILLNEDFKQFESTNEKLPYFYIPYWTPLEAIRWLLDKGSGSVSGLPGYLFYGNTLGLNYTTLESLFLSKEMEMDEDTKNVAMYKFNTTTQDISAIITWEMSHVDLQSFNVLRGGHRLGYDFETKNFINRYYNYKKSISKYTVFGRKTLFPDISMKNSRYELTGETDKNIIDNIYYSDFIKRYTKQMAMIITVRGHERRSAGLITSILWPSGDKEQVFNKNLEGKYLIKSVTHHFGMKSPTYTQKLVLLKTGYDDSNDKLLVTSSRMNLDFAKKMGSK